MSHTATNWAFRQRGLKPGCRIVLLMLADCHNPAHGGAFPSQEWLAAECEVPRSTLNVYLDELEKRGLIAREQRRQKGSQKQERTRYYFPFETEFQRFSAVKPSPESGHGDAAQAVSRNADEPSPENGQSRVQNLDSNPVREPVKEPVTERESASERDGQEEDNPLTVERAFKRWYPSWPTYVDDSEPKARMAWQRLTSAERLKAAEMTQAYVEAAKGSGRKYICSAQVYLAEKRWEKLADLPKTMTARPVLDRITVAVYGPAFAAAYMAEVLQRPLPVQLPPKIRDTVLATYDQRRRHNPQRARDYLDERGISLDADGNPVFPETFERDEERRQRMANGYPGANRLRDASRERGHVTVGVRFEAIKDLMEFVPVDSEMMSAWRSWYESNFLPFPPLTARGGYFPAGGPDRLDDFRAALARDEGEHDAA